MGTPNQLPPVRRPEGGFQPGRKSPRRWELQPLIDMARWRYRPVVTSKGDPLIYSERAVIIALGINGQSWKLMREQGLNDYQADRYAVMLGFHPSEVWGWEWFETGLTKEDRIDLAFDRLWWNCHGIPA